MKPLEQFEVHPLLHLSLGALDISMTNATLTLFLILTLIVCWFQLSLKSLHLIPTKWQSGVESIYGFIKSLTEEQVGQKGWAYFPYLLTLFTFILFSNLMGMIPFNFTLTSHFVVTFAFSIMVLIGVTIIGFLHHGWRFFKVFLPEGTPIPLIPLLIIIEVISYLARGISLAVRLAANLMAGHTLLKILATFTSQLLISTGWIAGLAGLGLISLLILLETGLAILQAYVFTLLTASYLKNGIDLH
jgi:ATP synthase subunit 6